MTPRVASDSLKLMYTQSLSPPDIAVPGCHGNSIEGGYKVDQLHVQYLPIKSWQKCAHFASVNVAQRRAQDASVTGS